MFVSPICTLSVVKLVPAAAAGRAMRIEKGQIKGSQSVTVQWSTGQTHPKPISAQLNDSNRSWDSARSERKGKE